MTGEATVGDNKFVSDLPACPFCGATTAAASDDAGPWEVVCGSCQAYTWGETEAEAVAAWCRRSQKSDRQGRR